MNGEKNNRGIMNKNSFGKFGNVKLTREEIIKLDNKFGSYNTTNKLIETLDYKIMDQPEKYNYKSHYRVILAWNRIKWHNGRKKGKPNFKPGSVNFSGIGMEMPKPKGYDYD